MKISSLYGRITDYLAIRPKLLLAAIFFFGLFSLFLANALKAPPQVFAQERILQSKLIRSNFWLNNLSLGGSGYVYGSRGRGLYKISQGAQANLVYKFEEPIRAIHERQDGLILIATDQDYWSADTPSKLHRSLDHGKTFKQVKKVRGGSFIWMSLASDSSGKLFAAEYGPQSKPWSKTLWYSSDNGSTWQVSYEAPNDDKTHLHRVAIDPFTDAVWLTVGDGKNRNMLLSQDHGQTWKSVAKLQATAVAFAEDAIYWGKDEKGKPGVVRYDRTTKEFSPYFNPAGFGNYGGSIYDMLLLSSGKLMVPFMKYPEENHIASLWTGKGDHWIPLLRLKSRRGKGAGLSTIAGPDKEGWIYLSGYQFRYENKESARPRPL